MHPLRETALVGGSFDPVHKGHLHLVHMVVSQSECRHFVLVPVAKGNFKRERKLASAKDRIAMLLLAIKAYPSLYPDDPPIVLTVDDTEIKRGGVSYTSDTVRELYGKYPVLGKIDVVIGDDLLTGLVGWHDWDYLRDHVRFIVARREKEEISPPVGADVFQLEGVPFPDSSSMIREGLSDEGMTERIRSLLPKEVADYVETHRLYRN